MQTYYRGLASLAIVRRSLPAVEADKGASVTDKLIPQSRVVTVCAASQLRGSMDAPRAVTRSLTLPESFSLERSRNRIPVRLYDRYRSPLP